MYVELNVLCCCSHYASQHEIHGSTLLTLPSRGPVHDLPWRWITLPLMAPKMIQAAAKDRKTLESTSR